MVNPGLSVGDPTTTGGQIITGEPGMFNGTQVATYLYQDKFNLNVLARYLSDLIQYNYPEIPLSERKSLLINKLL